MINTLIIVSSSARQRRPTVSMGAIIIANLSRCASGTKFLPLCSLAL